MSMRLSRFSEKYPMFLLSGDQNGPVAPSVPESSVLASVARFFNHSFETPSGLLALNTKRVPSGESAKSYATKEWFEGGSSEVRYAGAGGAGSLSLRPTKNKVTATSAASAASAGQSFRRLLIG